MNSEKSNKIASKLTSLLFYFSILFFIIAFNFTDVMIGNWYQQFMPSIGNRQITDITFLDSLTGYAAASPDTSFILKTINGGANWQIIYRQPALMTRLQFLNINTGFACGSYVYKTTNGGFNWTQISMLAVTAEDVYAINENTIWFVGSNSLVGGVFFTSNGGSNWIQQVNLGPANPDRIYMFNANLGFISRWQVNCCFFRTTNGGINWVQIPGESAFNDMYFVDSLTGWKAGPMKKTTNGGLNWVSQIMPTGGNISVSGISSFDNLNRDTIWGANGYLFYPGQGGRAFLHRTTNSGDTWYLQIPDTAYQIPRLSFIDFVDKYKGWAYMVAPRGIHTTVGGDTTFYLPVKQISSEEPKEFILFQNYPNPFNPRSNIKYQIVNEGKRQKAKVKINIYDITGREVVILVNEEQEAGTYEVEFNGSNYSSGVYFYSLYVNGNLIDTKRMILLK